MNDVLLTVSGEIPDGIRESISRGERPLADYLAMADTFGADLLDYRLARMETGPFGRLLEKLGGPNLMLAWACFRRSPQYQVIFTDGEQVGMPLSLFWGTMRTDHRPRHLMIAHILSTGKKQFLFDRLKLEQRIDTFFTYSTWQQEYITAHLKLPRERVVFTPFMVDADFFSAERAGTSSIAEIWHTSNQPILCTAGLEFRDYPTLIRAVEDLDVRVVIAAASPWSKRADSTQGQALPDNVIVRRFSQFELRELYHHSSFVVMPLYPVNFQAGVTAILEAMAMSKAVVCTHTPGQTDVVVEGQTGLYVPPGDPQALRKTIFRLLENPVEAKRMGINGRSRVDRVMSLQCYVERLSAYVN